MQTGDSGGPILAKINNRTHIIAVTSQGHPACERGVAGTSINMNTYKLRREILELIYECT